MASGDGGSDRHALDGPEAARAVALHAGDVSPAQGRPGVAPALEGRAVGWIGELHPEWVQRLELGTAPQLFELELDAIRRRPAPHYVPVSRQPVVQRDLAFVVDANVPAQTLLDALRSEAPAWVRQITLFDVYQGKNLPEGKKSYAVNFILQDESRTLTDKAIEAIMQKLMKNLTTKLHAELR